MMMLNSGLRELADHKRLIVLVIGLVLIIALPLGGLLLFNHGVVTARQVYEAKVNEQADELARLMSENNALTERVKELEKQAGAGQPALEQTGSLASGRDEYFRGIFDICMAAGYSPEQCNTVVLKIAKAGWYERASSGCEPPPASSGE